MRKAIKALAKKRTLFALVLALTIFGAVYGFAATLNVGTNTLSAGNATVASCQATGTPTGTYTVAYDSTLPGYKVAGVTVTGLDARLRQQGDLGDAHRRGNANLATITRHRAGRRRHRCALTPRRRPSPRPSSRASASRSTAKTPSSVPADEMRAGHLAAGAPRRSTRKRD